MLQIIIPSLAIDQDIIEENEHRLPQLFVKNLIHECLKCQRCIIEVERHNEELVMPFVSAERRLQHILFRYSNLVVPRVKVKLCEVAIPM